MSFFRQIEIFRTVMVSTSLTEASARLLISQPAITMQIKNLEAYVGVALFRRDGHKLQPTEYAKSLFEQSETAMESMLDLDRFARTLERTTIQSLNIAAMPMIARLWLPPRICTILKDFPNLDVTVEVTRSSKIIDLVEAGQTDIGLALPIRPVGTFHSKRLFNNRAVCIFQTGHALGAQNLITPSNIGSEDFILLGPVSFTRQHILASFEEAGIKPRIRAEVELEKLAIAMVEAGAGISIIDAYSARTRKEAGANIDCRPFEPKIEMNIDVLQSLSSRDPSLTRAIVDNYLAV